MTTISTIIFIVCILLAIGSLIGVILLLLHVFSVYQSCKEIERRFYSNIYSKMVSLNKNEYVGAYFDFLEKLLEEALKFLVAADLVVERRLSNNITKLVYILEPFFVTLTKNQLPDELKPEYMNVEEPIFDSQEEIEDTRKKVQEIIEQAGKLMVGEDNDSGLVEFTKASTSLNRALRLTAILLPLFSTILFVAVGISIAMFVD